jgi:26S proteasome regulatory subunit N10
MTLEATLIMMDNSAFGINGDYEPTRWDSQVDLAALLIQAKLEANQQSSVGVGLIGGAQVQVLCTLTSDSGKASSFLYGVKCSGELHFTQVILLPFRPYKLEHCLSNIALTKHRNNA